MMSDYTYSAKIGKAIFAVSLVFVLVPACWAQDKTQSSTENSNQESGTSTDLFVMFGSDFVRPGLAPKANYNIGIGRTFGFLKKDPIGDELTFAYTYEDGGSRFLALPIRFSYREFWSHEELRTPEDEAC
jgi:hypothetical protein